MSWVLDQAEFHFLWKMIQRILPKWHGFKHSQLVALPPRGPGPVDHISKLFRKQTYFVRKFYYQISMYNVVVVLCSIKLICLEFETVVLKWQEQHLRAQLPSSTWLPSSCILSSLTFLTFYSVFFFFFLFILSPPFFPAFFLSKCPNILSTIPRSNSANYKGKERKKKDLILTLQIEESNSLKLWWPKGMWKPVNVQKQSANYSFLNGYFSSPHLGAVSTSNCLLTRKKWFFSDTNQFFRTLAITPPGVRHSSWQQQQWRDGDQGLSGSVNFQECCLIKRGHTGAWWREHAV